MTEYRSRMVFVLAGVALCAAMLEGQVRDLRGTEEDPMAWFRDAKLGIFIHWGYYAVNGISESWSIYNRQISHADYLKQAAGFTASHYDPEAWAALFKESGARYAVLTTKHHDGIALWGTRQSRLNVVEKTPAHRDLIAPYCAALRAAGLRVGLYYSLCDWSHPDYAVPFSRANAPDSVYHTDDYPRPARDAPTPWARFTLFFRSQLREIQESFHPDLWWFDGDWEHSAEEWGAKDIRDSLKRWNPRAIINSRLQGYGDYKTPEQDPPIRRLDPPWELCMTINDNWGYRPSDTNFKSIREIIRLFAECVGGGGNLLLDVGPRPDGTIPEQEASRLRALGAWIHRHAEAIYGSRAGLPPGYFYGPSTLSSDSSALYLILFDQPRGFVALKGIRNPIRDIRVLGSGETLRWFVRDSAPWNDIPGIVYISPPTQLDEYATVIRVSLDGPLKLFKESGQ